jgi:aryl-phospho-beta-D-glucosidase BglC (GH1 family)
VAVATPLSTSGRFIVDATGTRVRLAGVNWYGASEDMGVPVGLDVVHRNTLAGIIAELGFNCVRFPFSLWMMEQTTPVPQARLAANSDLYGYTPIMVYEACVEALANAGLIVIPNCHLLDFGWCCGDNDANGLWFNDRWPAENFTTAWQQMTGLFTSTPLVAAMDVKNEPRPATVGGRVLSPTWGTGAGTDFAAMYTSIGNLIHQVNPDLLIICEGLGYACDLTGVAAHPVRLNKPGKVVYSMHDYSWFHAKGQTAAQYAQAMNKAGGYILTEQIAPLWIGEFGDDVGSVANINVDPASGPGNTEAGWWTNIFAWLIGADIDWCWWALNPTHGQAITPGINQQHYSWGDREPYGLLAADWSGAATPGVMNALQMIMKPRTGPGVGKPAAPNRAPA